MFKIVLVCALFALAVAAPDHAIIDIKTQSADVRADGFDVVLETSDGSSHLASGDAYGNHQGSFGWVSPEGVAVNVKYVANEGGYQPSGEFVPTPPPVPAYILKALEYIAAHPPKN